MKTTQHDTHDARNGTLLRQTIYDYLLERDNAVVEFLRGELIKTSTAMMTLAWDAEDHKTMNFAYDQHQGLLGILQERVSAADLTAMMNALNRVYMFLKMKYGKL